MQNRLVTSRVLMILDYGDRSITMKGTMSRCNWTLDKIPTPPANTEHLVTD